MAPQSTSKEAPSDLTQFSQLPSAAPTYFSVSHQGSEISSISKVILVFGQERSHRVPNVGYRGAESPGWFDVLPKTFARDVMNKWACCCDEVVSHQLHIAMAFWIIQIVSAKERSSLTQNMMQICCSTHSVILNTVGTEYKRSLKVIYHFPPLLPPQLVQ